MRTIAVFVGSLRKESINRKLATALAHIGNDMFHCVVVPLGDVPMYNQDMEDNLPPPVVRMKQAVADADGVLLVTPEYNRSVPPVLKNAIDWGTRPPGKNIWAGKPAALAGMSVGSVGTGIVQTHLQSLMVQLGMTVMGQPTVFLTWNEKYFDEAGHIADKGNETFLRGFLTRFSNWVEQHGLARK